MTSHGGPSQGPRARRVAIIGGGFSGAALVYHLAHLAATPLEIVLIEPNLSLGKGVAYKPSRHPLLLNVPAGKLSIDPGRPGDFHVWCDAAGRRTQPDAFLPRTWFGEYCEARMAERVAGTSGMVRVRHLHETATGVRRLDPGVEIGCSHGNSVVADHAVLALGHGPTRVPAALQPYQRTDLIVASPWNEAAMERLAQSATRVMLVGTGLTMCDAAILLARSGFEGEMIAVSRRGLLPREHGPSSPAEHAQWAASLAGKTLPKLVREVLTRADETNWRGVIDALRPHTASIWKALNQRDRRRFLSRITPYWDTHRHRMPQDVASAMHVLGRSGRFRVVRGGIHSAGQSRDRLRCDLVDARTEARERIDVDAAVLCTGGEPDPSRWGSTLIADLLRQGLTQLDGSGLGLCSTHDGLLVDAGGNPRPDISTIGPLRRGDLWESTAVPELSKQAEALARLIALHPGSDESTAPTTAGKEMA